MATTLDVHRLDRALGFLRALPDSLFDEVVAATGATLGERVSAVAALREALLRGCLPPPHTLRWPEEPVRSKLLSALDSLRLPRFCKDQPELAEDLLRQILASTRAYERGIDERMGEVFARLRQVEEERLRVQAEQDRRRTKGRGASTPLATLDKSPASPGGPGVSAAHPGGAAAPDDTPPIVIPAATLDRLRAEARRLVAVDASAAAAADLDKVWRARAEAWSALEEVFGALGQLLGRGWDLGLGLLHQEGWREVARLHALLKQLPALRTLLETLGRLQQRPEAPGTETASVRIFGPVRRTEEVETVRPHPQAVSDTRGIERSGEVSRMLPSEAALLGHPRLRVLWHARRAERLLMSYRIEGLETTWTTEEVEGLEAQEHEERRPRDGRGPIIVCLDTSGSMAGLPEQIAKALTLEALRTALAEGRRCLVYSFSGPGQMAEQELDLSVEGLATFLAFLIQSFHGGTDVDAPLRAAITRIRTQRWEKADVLLVSDGEFGVLPELVADLKALKDGAGTRVHGLLIGGGRSDAMERLCEPLHPFASWNQVVA